MKKLLRPALVAVLLSLAALPAFATATVSGIVYLHGAYDSYYYPGANTYVKFCVANVYGLVGQGECYLTVTNSSSVYSVAVAENKTYYMFVWNDTYYWGSPSILAWSNGNASSYITSVYVPYSFSGFPLIAEPRPLPVSPISPLNNATNVPLNITLKWTNGLDGYRNWPGVWTVTYDIYGYGEGGTELKELSDISCNPDASGYCSYPITNLVPNWRYYWRVVPKIKVTPGNRVFQQSSSTFTFVTTP